MTLLLSALLLAAMQTDGPLPIELRWDGVTCTTLIDGVAVSPEQVPTEIKRWARHGRPVEISGPAETPYRCVGGAIFALQSGGYRLIGGFGPAPGLSVSMAATVRLTVMPGACAYRPNDEPVTESELPALMAGWKRYEAQVELKAEPKARHQCFDAVMRHIANADIRTVGFVGNDDAAEESEVAPR